MKIANNAKYDENKHEFFNSNLRGIEENGKTKIFIAKYKKNAIVCCKCGKVNLQP